MKLHYQDTDIKNMILDTGYTNFFQEHHTDMIELDHGGILGMGNVHFREILTKDMRIGYGSLRLGYQAKVSFTNPNHSVNMSFVLKGSIQSFDRASNLGTVLLGNQHNISYSPGFDGFMEFSDTSTIENFEVSLSPFFFSEHLPNENNFFLDFLKSIHAKKTSRLHDSNLLITHQMRCIISEVINCTKVGTFKKLFLEIKVLELLLLQIEQVLGGKGTKLYSLSATDIEKMYHLKQILDENLDTMPTLKGLSRQLYLNEFKLKKGFKEVFGHTIFEYIKHQKMEMAKRMIVEEKKTIGEVSELVGYKHAHHFATAFKKHYGVLPSSLK